MGGGELAVHGGLDAAQIAAQAYEGLPVRAEGIADRHLGITESLAEQVEGEHLSVVVVVPDFGLGRRPRRERAVAALPVGEVVSAGQEPDPTREDKMPIRSLVPS